jgi:hypothetical protein
MKTTMNHIMLDIETLGKNSNAVVVSISAVIFDMNTGEVGDTFEIGLDIKEQVSKGGIIDQETVNWWNDQSEDAKKELERLKKEPVYIALLTFNNWIKTNFKAPSKIKLWGNGSTFDNVIVRNLYERHELEFVIPYYANRDVRTLTYLEKVNPKSYPFVGIKHRGIDDCKHQIKYCTDAYIKKNTVSKSLCDSCLINKETCFLAEGFEVVSACISYKENTDRLAELEAQILKYYLLKGYKLKKDQTKDDIEWSFKINIFTQLKDKLIQIYLLEDIVENENGSRIFETTQTTTKEMFDKAFEHFDTTKHLCDKCIYEIPTCKSNEKIFGNGTGNDNIIECDGYKNEQ